MVTDPFDSSADNVCLSSLPKPLNKMDCEDCEDDNANWSLFSSSFSSLEDTVGNSTTGEEGLTQSPTSEEGECDETLKNQLQECEFSLSEEFSEERQSAFDVIHDALKRTPDGFHPFLNMDEQRLMIGNERMQRRYEFFLSAGRRAAVPAGDLGALSKSLLREAHRVHISLVRRHNKTCCEKSLPMKNEEEINSQWRRIESAVEQDLYLEGFVHVQRRLSCMCLFNPDTDERPYWDNESAREQRLRRQERILERIKEQAQSGGGCFLSSA